MGKFWTYFGKKSYVGQILIVVNDQMLKISGHTATKPALTKRSLG